jgi:hypothetical protein
MTKDEISLLLFFETNAADYAGIVDIRRMNQSDRDKAEEWAKNGFIEFGRIYSKDITAAGTHYVHLSPEAFDAAYNERRARAIRLWDNRTYKKAIEK